MMKNLILFGIIIYLANPAYAAEMKTRRIPQFENEKVKVWETIIYPSSSQKLPFHRHEHDRVLVALTGGVLKATNHKGESYEFRLEKNKAYYLRANEPGESHYDENKSSHPIKVMVIELK